jgi:ATP-dependent helicase HrpA
MRTRRSNAANIATPKSCRCMRACPRATRTACSIPGPQRRIVLATNVAETSLTVPRIHAVVDPGLARVKRYSPRQKLDRLHIEPISQASADQRKGRCGRIAPGTCYRLYSEADFESRARFTDPEIRRAALAGVILRMLSLGWAASRISRSSNRRIRARSPMAGSNCTNSARSKRRDKGAQAHAIGRTMARLPVDVKLARMLIAANERGCLREMLAIAAFLGIQDPRERPVDQRAAADNAHAEFADPEVGVRRHRQVVGRVPQAHEDLTQSKLRQWAEKHFLGFLRLREWRELHRQLKLLCDELGWQQNDDRRAVRRPASRVADGPADATRSTAPIAISTTGRAVASSSCSPVRRWRKNRHRGCCRRRCSTPSACGR